MAFVTVYEDIIFIEGEHPRAVIKGRAYTRIGGFGAQLRNLNDLKAVMASTAKQNGCNCIINFSYTQKHKLISIDKVAFVGNGYYTILSQKDYDSIISRFKN